jgi:8-oxo-dGTP pyrophosphatase MutT (NUDIX family)
MGVEPDALKVAIYVVHDGDLLVFLEPDFPEVLLQVPGGTVEGGESITEAAQRELAKETGLSVDAAFEAIGTQDYRFDRDGHSVWHLRHVFLVRLPQRLADYWDHVEQSPFNGGPPIRFSFQWLPFEDAANKLGYGFEPPLARVVRNWHAKPDQRPNCRSLS